VIVPSTIAWLFASLTSAVSFSLTSVIVGDFIGAEHCIGRMIIEAEARGKASGMMVAVFVLMFCRRRAVGDHLGGYGPISCAGSRAIR
jgi:NitT/TauT family transport system permease protein